GLPRDGRGRVRRGRRVPLRAPPPRRHAVLAGQRDVARDGGCRRRGRHRPGAPDDGLRAGRGGPGADPRPAPLLRPGRGRVPGPGRRARRRAPRRPGRPRAAQRPGRLARLAGRDRPLRRVDGDGRARARVRAAAGDRGVPGRARPPPDRASRRCRLPGPAHHHRARHPRVRRVARPAGRRRRVGLPVPDHRGEPGRRLPTGAAPVRARHPRLHRHRLEHDHRPGGRGARGRGGGAPHRRAPQRARRGRRRRPDRLPAHRRQPLRRRGAGPRLGGRRRARPVPPVPRRRRGARCGGGADLRRIRRRAEPHGGSLMDFALSPELIDLRTRVRALVDDHLVHYETEAEEHHGRLSAESHARIKRAVLESGLAANNIPKEFGGGGFNLTEQIVTHEQLGRLTNCLWVLVWSPSNVLVHGTPEQIERYLLPDVRGDHRHAYAITEEAAGSDPRAIASEAVWNGSQYELSGTKWFVTDGDVASYFIVLAWAVDGHDRRPALFLVDKDAPGVEMTDDPDFSHNFPYRHPEFTFTKTPVPRENILGDLGRGFELTGEWFVEERVHIAARCVGACDRLIE